MALSKKPTNTCHGSLIWQGFKAYIYIYIYNHFLLMKKINSIENWQNQNLQQQKKRIGQNFERIKIKILKTSFFKNYGSL